MKIKLKEKLIDIAKQRISSDDPSHDFLHALRVLVVAEQIAKEEKADLDIKVKARMNTATAKKMAQRRTLFLQAFLRELELELKGE